MTNVKFSTLYPLPERLQPRLAELEGYWDSIKRGFGIMPYWDDLDMTKLAALRNQVMLFDVMEGQPRFRFNLVGASIAEAYGESLDGRFADEVPPTSPFHELSEQCRATVTESAPTYFRFAPAEGEPYARLLLPLWGNGYIQMLIGAIESGG